MATGGLHPHELRPPPYHGNQTDYTGGTVSQPVSKPEVHDVQRHLRCCHCQTAVITQIHYVPGRFTYLMMVLAGLLTLLLFFWVPLCLKKCKDVKHTCPNCAKVIYVHKRL